MLYPPADRLRRQDLYRRLARLCRSGDAGDHRADRAVDRPPSRHAGRAQGGARRRRRAGQLSRARPARRRGVRRARCAWRRSRKPHPAVRHRQPRLRDHVVRCGAHRRRSGRRLRSLQGAGPALFPARHRGAVSLHRRRAVAEARGDRRRSAVIAGNDFRARRGGGAAGARGPARGPVRGDRQFRRTRRRRLPAPSQRRRLHVLLRRHHRHRQGHHPSRP